MNRNIYETDDINIFCIVAYRKLFKKEQKRIDVLKKSSFHSRIL